MTSPSAVTKCGVYSIGYLPTDHGDYRDEKVAHAILPEDPARAFKQAKGHYQKFGDLRILLYYRMQHFRQGRSLPPQLASYIEERVEEGEAWGVRGPTGLSWQVLFDFVTHRWPSSKEDMERYMLRCVTMLEMVPLEVRVDASSVLAYHHWSSQKLQESGNVQGDYLRFSVVAELAGVRRKLEVRMGGLDGSLFVVVDNLDDAKYGDGYVRVNMSYKFFETLRKRYFGTLNKTILFYFAELLLLF